MKIAIAGIGYVGLSNAILLAQHNDVVAYDISADRVGLINSRQSPIDDVDIIEYLKNKDLNISATNVSKDAFTDAKIIIVATSTDFDPATNKFNTKSIEDVVTQIKAVNTDGLIIIKSTVPIGYTDKICKQFDCDNIVFSPEFLREGKALHDNLYPSRIVIGEDSERARVFANLLEQGAIKKDIPVHYTGSKEAEAIKLFANSYLAMRVSYFNELDTFAMMNGLNPRELISGICEDDRIGKSYNNPSFGYGGYCLPKDTKQLLANYEGVPQELIGGINKSNETRMRFIADQIIKLKPNTVGIYKLGMKLNSDNYRSSSILRILELLDHKIDNIIIYEPTLSVDNLSNFNFMTDLDKFKANADVIVTNRMSLELDDVKHKVFTRDVFNNN